MPRHTICVCVCVPLSAALTAPPPTAVDRWQLAVLLQPAARVPWRFASRRLYLVASWPARWVCEPPVVAVQRRACAEAVVHTMVSCKPRPRPLPPCHSTSMCSLAPPLVAQSSWSCTHWCVRVLWVGGGGLGWGGGVWRATLPEDACLPCADRVCHGSTGPREDAHATGDRACCWSQGVGARWLAQRAGN